jgi:hypothetical protein
MRYRPRRSSKRWLEQAPEYVLACYDNGGLTADRYTILFGDSMWEPEMGRNVFYLTMSSVPNHPQGVSMWGEMPANNRQACGKHVRWLDLPDNIREHTLHRATEGDNPQ